MNDNVYHASIVEVQKKLIERDEADNKISIANKKDLISKGLTINPAKRRIRINTGEVVGISNVVKVIAGELREHEKIIAIEGLSGVGKSSTAKELRKALNAISFSFGEIFRYLCYLQNVKELVNHNENIAKVSYKIIDNSLCLIEGETNITKELERELCEPYLVSLVPNTAALTQEIAIKFVAKEIEKIREDTKNRIIIEGRDYTLDFLPCDLRVELFADSMIRAKRRLSQDID